MNGVQTQTAEAEIRGNKLLFLIICDLFVLTAVSFLTPLQAIAVIVVLFLAAFFVLSPLGYLYFLLVWMPYEALILPEGEAVRILRLLAISMIIILGWTKFWLSSNTIRFPNRYIMIPILAFFSWSAITIFFSPMIFSAFFTFMKMMAYLAILLLVYNMISSTDDLRRLLYFLFLISIPIYLAAYYQFFVMGFLRVWGVFGNPNTMGLYAFTSVGMALALKELKGGANHTKIVVPVWIFLSLTTLILSGSRASILGLAIFGAIYLILNRKYLLLGAAALLVLLGGYYLVHSQTLFLDFARVARLMAGLTGRTIIWETTIDMIRDHPIFGVGPGNVYGLLYTYAQATHPIVSIDLRSAMERGLTHNGYLQQLAEIGVMGLIIALWAVYRFIKYNMAIIRNHGKKSIHKISMVVLALFIGRLVHSFFESDLDIGPFTLEMSVLILYISFIRLNDPYSN